MHYAAHAQAEKFIYLAHPGGIALGKVVVYGYYVYAAPGKRVEVSGQRLGYGLALACLHLGNAALMQHYAAVKLNVKVPLPYCAHRSLAHGGVSLGQYIVKRFAACKPFFELISPGPKLAVRKGAQLRLKLVYGFYYGHSQHGF